MYLLHQKLGVSAIIGAAFCICTMIPLQFLIGKKMSANSKAITVSVVTSVITFIQSLQQFITLHTGILTLAISK